MRCVLYIMSCWLTLLFVFSCERVTALDSGERPQVVVECFLNNVPGQSLMLSFAKCPSEDKARKLEQAEAKLIDVTESRVAGYFERSKEGVWKLDYAAIPLHKYRLEVKVPDYDLIWAEDMVPDVLDIDYINIHEYPSLAVSDSETGAYFRKNIELSDEELNIHGRFLMSGYFFLTESLPRHILVYAMIYEGSKTGHRISDWICTDLSGVSDINLVGDVYYGNMTEYRDEGGLFYAYRYPQLVGQSLHSKFLLIDNVEPGKGEKYFALSSGFGKGNQNNRENDYYYVGTWGYECGKSCPHGNHRYVERSETMSYYVIESLSDVYFDYLNNALGMIKQDGSTDYADYFIRDNVFSNINGGIGIFAASTSTECPYVQTDTYCGRIQEP